MTTPPPPAQQQPTAASQQQATTAIESQAATLSATSTQAQAAVTAYLLNAFGDSEDSWYDTSEITSLARNLARISDGFSVATARNMDSFMADSVEWLTGKKIQSVGIRRTLGLTGERGVRTGITTAGVFGRSADTYRYQQAVIDQQFVDDVEAGVSEPTELAAPLDAAVERAKRAAQLNVALAGRNQAVATLTQAVREGVISGYRRVLHAELSHEGSCGLCVADSTRVYRSDHLLPMHPGCHCIPVPLTSTRDPGAAINDRDLARFYDAAGGSSAEKLRKTRYKVDEHGEVGPVLRPFDAPIRTAKQAARDTNRPRRPKTTEQMIRTLRSRRDKLDQAMQKAPMVPTPAWRARMEQVGHRIDRLDREIVKLGG